MRLCSNKKRNKVKKRLIKRNVKIGLQEREREKTVHLLVKNREKEGRCREGRKTEEKIR